jgi:ABC-type branched-subunit amino acid transport system substrate-binding protein
MSRKARVRAGALVVCAAALISSGASSCGASNSSVTASGTTLAIYLSQAPGAGAAAQDVTDAEQLAFQQLGGSAIGKYRVRLVKTSGAEISDNARTAIQNTGAIAYLGEIQPGASAGSIGITNAQDLLQVSPTDTALELTQSTPAISNTPNRYYEQLKAYGRTFARLVPSSGAEAKAQVAKMKSLGVARLFLTGDGSPYGLALAAAIKTQAAAQSIAIAPIAAGADAIFYAGQSPSGAARAFGSAASSEKLFAPSALDQPATLSALGGSSANVLISVPSTPPNAKTTVDKFTSDFKAAYGHAPAAEAVFGYAAMQAVLFALRQAGSSANNRDKVVSQFFSIRNNVPASVIGPYSINTNGDTSLSTFNFDRVEHGAFVRVK